MNKVEEDKSLVKVLLSDNKGQVRVFFPSDCILDIDRLNKSHSRNFRAYPPIKQSEDSQHSPKDTTPDLLLASPNGNPAGIDQAFGFDCVIPLSQIPVSYGDLRSDRPQFEHSIQRFTTLRIKQRIDDTLELPPLPETAQAVMQLRSDPNASVRQLADVVERDPGLAAQVISWANSAFYSPLAPVHSIYDAVLRVLGFEMVMNLAMGLSLGRPLAPPKDAPLTLKQYWTQAIWMAQGATAVAKLMPPRHRPAMGMVYLSGLLHNFGYLLLAHTFTPHLSLVDRYAKVNAHAGVEHIEQFALGITREQIAGLLLAQWEIPDEVVVAVRHQKNVEYQGPRSDFPVILRLAKQCLVERGVDMGEPYNPDRKLTDLLEINPGQLDSAMDDLVRSRQDVLSLAQMLQTG